MTGRWNDAARLRRQRASRERRRGKRGEIAIRDRRGGHRERRRRRRWKRDRGVHARARATPLRERGPARTWQGRPRHSKAFALAPSLSLSSASRERPLRIRKPSRTEPMEDKKRGEHAPARPGTLLTCKRGNPWGKRDEIWILPPRLLLLLLIPRSFGRFSRFCFVLKVHLTGNLRYRAVVSILTFVLCRANALYFW